MLGAQQGSLSHVASAHARPHGLQEPACEPLCGGGSGLGALAAGHEGIWALQRCRRREHACGMQLWCIAGGAGMRVAHHGPLVGRVKVHAARPPVQLVVVLRRKRVQNAQPNPAVNLSWLSQEHGGGVGRGRL